MKFWNTDKKKIRYYQYSFTFLKKKKRYYNNGICEEFSTFFNTYKACIELEERLNLNKNSVCILNWQEITFKEFSQIKKIENLNGIK